MNIYQTDVRPSIFDPAVLVARCPNCGSIIVVTKDHAVCDHCGEDIFIVEED